MLSRYNNSRSIQDDIKLGVLTAFAAGMTNVAALVLFFSFASNITGHFAILAEEITKGNWYQVAVVVLWLVLFLGGSFLSNFIIINAHRRRRMLFHALPLVLEMACLLGVGWYGHFHYRGTLLETEALVAVLLFAMGLQNGLTASISNFAVKTTHLTGLVTDLAIHLSMATKAHWRKSPQVRNKLLLLSSIALAYLGGGILSGSIIHWVQFRVFFFIALMLCSILVYELAHYRKLLAERPLRVEQRRAERSAALATMALPLRNALPERDTDRLRNPTPELSEVV